MPRINVPFNVAKRKLTQFPISNLVSSSQNYFYITVVLDDEWQDVEPKMAVFKRDKRSFITDLEYSEEYKTWEALIPYEVMEERGQFYVGVFGGDRIVTNWALVNVAQGCGTYGAEPGSPYRDWFVIIEEEIDDIRDYIRTLAGDMTKAVYDPEETVLEAGGIPNYVKEKIAEKPSIEKLDTYLYQVTYTSLQLSEPTNYSLGACSSFVKDGKLYRNFDWSYNENKSFIVNTPDFTGMAFGTLDDIDSLPYKVVDGVNKYGIKIATHILYNDWDWHGEGNTPLYKVPYLALTTMHSIQDINNLPLSDLCNIPTLEELEYVAQFIVTDGTTTYVITPSANGYSIVNATSNPKLTNFKWVNKATVIRTELQERPTGVERWNAIDDSLEDLRFTKCYEAPTRLSEFIGIDGTTKDSSDAELEVIYERAHTEYLRRQRDGKTWQTMHSVVYGKTLENLWVQEDFEKDYSDIATKAWVKQQGYQNESQVQSIVDSHHDDTKQDIISDLDDIRSGAALGATSVQPDDIADMATETWVETNYYDKDSTDDLLDVKADESDLTTHIENTSNPHSVTKAQVGLGNVDNTSDADKPVSTAQQTALDTKVNKLVMQSTPVITDGNFTTEGDLVKVTYSKKNIVTGTTSTKDVNIPLADDENAGAMSPASVTAIQTLTEKVAALEGQTVRLIYTTKSNPIASEIQAFVESLGYTDQTKWAYIGVIVKATNHIWRYYANDGWTDIGLDTVVQFTNQIPGIILGSNVDGQVYAEDDGKGSVVGWDSVKTRITNIEAKEDSWDAKYDLPDTGIPKSNLSSGVQSSLDKADTAYQKPSAGIPKTDLTSEVQTSLGKADSSVQQRTGYDLSQNDFTNALKSKLDGIESGAEANVNADWNSSSGDSQILNKPTFKTVNGTSILGSGNISIPVPTKMSELTNDSGFQTSSDVQNTVSGAINTHNSSNTSHQDIRDAIPTNNNQLTNGAGYITADEVPSPITYSPSQPTGDWSIWCKPTPKPIGGQIFYDDGDNGATYTFFDANGNEVPYNGTIASLANATQYVVSGTPTKDRFYAFNHELSFSRIWGKLGTIVGNPDDSVGAGKPNTARALRLTGWENNSIFKYITDCNSNKLNGCADWYICSYQEFMKLHYSGLIDNDWKNFVDPNIPAPASKVCFWCSNEYSPTQGGGRFRDGSYARYKDAWTFDSGETLFSCFATRSF